MGLIEKIKSSIVAFDTNCLIYYIEKNPRYSNIVKQFFQAIENNILQGITTTITLVEVLTLPFKQKKIDLVMQYLNILTDSENIELLPIDNNIAKQAAILRAKYDNLRTPDALQIAAGIIHSAGAFICNDTRLKCVQEIPVILLDDSLF